MKGFVYGDIKRINNDKFWYLTSIFNPNKQEYFEPYESNAYKVIQEKCKKKGINVGMKFKLIEYYLIDSETLQIDKLLFSK